MKALAIALLLFSVSHISFASDCAKAVGPDAKRLSENQQTDGVVTETRRVKRGNITTFEEVEVGSANFEESDSDTDAFGGFSDGGDNIDAFGDF